MNKKDESVRIPKNNRGHAPSKLTCGELFTKIIIAELLKFCPGITT